MPILFDDGVIRVVQRKGSAKNGGPRGTIVTFADLTFRPDGEKFWGEKPAHGLGYDAIGIVSYGRDWFQSASLEKAAGIIREQLLPRSLVCGYSMGAYAALKYGRMLGSSRALAICPQYSINPLDVPGDNRFTKDFVPTLHHDMAIKRSDLTDFAVQFSDPYYIDDRINSEALSAIGGIEWVKTPFLNHYTIWLLTETDFLKHILDATLDSDAGRIRNLMRQRRGLTSHWFRHIGRTAMVRGRDELAVKLWMRAEAMGQHDSLKYHDLLSTVPTMLNRHFSRQSPDKALAAVARLRPLLETEVRGREIIGNALRVGGRGKDAEETFRTIVSVDPANSRTWLDLTSMLDRQGRFQDAIDVARKGGEASTENVDLPIVADWLNACLRIVEGRLEDGLADLVHLQPRLEESATAAETINHHFLHNNQRLTEGERPQTFAEGMAISLSVWLLSAYRLDLHDRLADAAEVAAAGFESRLEDIGLRMTSNWLNIRQGLINGNLDKAKANLIELDLACRDHAESLKAIHQYLIVNHKKDAIQERFRVTLAQSPKVATLWLAFARALDSQGRMADAALVAKAGSDAHPTDLELAIIAGWKLLQVGPLSSAAQCFRRALSDRPEGIRHLAAMREARLRVGLSKALCGAGDHAAGFQEAKAAIMLAPRDPLSWLWLGRCLVRATRPMSISLRRSI